MAPPVKATYQDVVDAQRRMMRRLTEQRGVARVKRLYDAAQSDLASRLGRKLGRGDDTFTSYQQQLAMAQIVGAQTDLAWQMALELGDAARDTSVDTLRQLGEDLTRLQRAYGDPRQVLPIEEAARFWGVIDERKTSMMRMHEASMSEYGADLVGNMEQQIGLGRATGQNTSQIIDRVLGVADMQWWKGERIVRTELSWAANATHSDGLAECRQVLPDLKQRWVEHCSDGSPPIPMDDRVGDDSIAMHGQVVVPGALFTMPPDSPTGKPVSLSLVGRTWAFPPNRPNDRATISPWRPDWEIPGWEWRGRRVPV